MKQNLQELQYLKPELLSLLSNSVGVERSLIDCGIRKNAREHSPVLHKTPEETSSNSASNVHLTSSKNGSGIKRTGSDHSNQGLNPGTKVPKWFKPGKPTQ